MSEDFSFSPELITSIETFVKTLKDHPKMLGSKDLAFFRDYLKSLGARIPTFDSTSDEGPKFTAPAPEAFEQDEEEEEEIEYPTLEEEGIIPKDDLDTTIEMGDPDQVVSDEDLEQSNTLKIEAVGLFGEGNYEESVKKYSDAIKLNSGSALLYAKRAQCFIQLKKPNAAIRDCNRALQINPDSAIAYKFRGRAHRLLGHWEEAARDLRQHQLIDFDETAEEWLKEVTPNAKKIEEWRLKKKRQDDEKELKHRKKLLAERQRAHEQAKSAPAHDFEMPDFDMPGGGGGGGGATGIPGLDNLMKDPEVIQLFQDPEVSAAFADISTNPMNILKYQSNPKVAKLLKILQTKMGGGMPGMGMPGGGFPGMGGMGGFPGGMGGFPGGMPNFGGDGGGEPNPKPPGDVDLD